jgi:hypothetical protein
MKGCSEKVRKYSSVESDFSQMLMCGQRVIPRSMLRQYQTSYRMIWQCIMIFPESILRNGQKVLNSGHFDWYCLGVTPNLALNAWMKVDKLV